MIESGSARKYALYAIGEIALVVIGILIALEINNWNEGRKIKVQLIDHLENLAIDLNEDITEYDEKYSHHHMRFYSFMYLFDLAGYPLNIYEPFPDPETPWEKHKELYPYPDTFSMDFIKFGYNWMDHGYVSTKLSRTAVEEIKNLGLFSQIRNAKLKKQINDYYKYVDWVFGEAIIQDYQRQAQELGVYLRDHYGIINIDISDLDDPIGFLKQHKDVRLKLRSVTNDSYYHTLEMLRSKRKAEELIQLIKDELRNTLRYQYNN